MSSASADPLLTLHDVTVEFRSRTFLVSKSLRAVDGVSLHVARGETLGLVGESGSGKTTLGRVVLRLTAPTSGRVVFDGIDMLAANRGQLAMLRKRVQAVFQDPYRSLNGRMTVEQMLTEPLRVHFPSMDRAGRRRRVMEMMDLVGLEQYHLARRPSAFSGGQRQRIAIARALMVEPDLLICDEPVSALDMSTQAQVVNLLEELQRKTGVSLVLIGHDLAVVRHTSHRIAVIYRGKIVESGPADDVCSRPRHPYTASLIAAVPSPDPDRQQAQREHRLRLREPSASRRAAASEGCDFAPTCPFSMERCWTERPVLRPVRDNGRGVTVASCHLYDSGDRPGLLTETSHVTSDGNW